MANGYGVCFVEVYEVEIEEMLWSVLDCSVPVKSAFFCPSSLKGVC